MKHIRIADTTLCGGNYTFKKNIDRHGDGTAAFICEAIRRALKM